MPGMGHGEGEIGHFGALIPMGKLARLLGAVPVSGTAGPVMRCESRTLRASREGTPNSDDHPTLPEYVTAATRPL